MEIIKIFLASSSELKDDREQFEIFINRKNKEWVSNNIFLHLNIWEDFIDAMSQTRLQDEYNKTITECDIFIMLFFTKVGRHTKEEFTTAFGQFKETNKPLIYTYFKDTEIRSSDINKDFNSVLQFKKRLEKLGHFYSTYQNIADLKLQITNQLTKLYPNRFNETVATKQSKKYPRELTPIQHIDPSDIIGRDSELEELHQHLFNNKKVIVVNGLGGIGKTMLAQAYISKYGDSYHHLAWVSQTGDHAAKAFLDNKDLIDNLDIDISKIDEKDRLRTIFNKQRSIEVKPNLLVIDNADQTICDFYNLLPGYPNWHVLVTSREEIEHFEIIKLDFLKPEQAVALFKKHCQFISNEDHIATLLKTVEYHTLTIEILAKTAELRRVPFEKLMNAIELDLKANVYIGRELSKIEKVTTYLKSIFNFNKLTDEQEWIMKQFCFLPPDFHAYNLLFELLQVNSLAWADDFPENINNLCKNGWLLKNIKTDSFKMHRIINEITINKLTPAYVDVKNLLQNVADLLYLKEDEDDYCLL